MNDWKEIQIEGISNIERIVAVFQVWSISKFPSAKVKIKILESRRGEHYTGVANVTVKSKIDGTPDWTSGGGKTVKAALEQTIKNLLASIEEHEAVTDEQFLWADPEEF